MKAGLDRIQAFGEAKKNLVNENEALYNRLKSVKPTLSIKIDASVKTSEQEVWLQCMDLHDTRMKLIREYAYADQSTFSDWKESLEIRRVERSAPSIPVIKHTSKHRRRQRAAQFTRLCDYRMCQRSTCRFYHPNDGELDEYFKKMGIAYVGIPDATMEVITSKTRRDNHIENIK